MEEDIAAQLAATVPRNEEQEAPIIAPPPILTNEQSSVVEPVVNELTLFKLGNELGITNPQGKVNDMLRYIYEQLHRDGETYDEVVSSVRDYLTSLGLTFAPDRLIKLHTWLKLNQERRLIEQEMSKI